MLKNKVVLITGVSKGIGLSCLKLCLENNAYVIGVSRGKFKQESLEKKYNKNLKILYGDITKKTTLKKISNFQKKKNFDINCIVNNAGMRFRKKFLKIDIKNYKKVFDNNFFSIVSLTQEYIKKAIKKNKIISIVNLSSIVGTRGFEELSAYGSSKGALDAFTKCIAVEFPKHVRINNICPGFTKSSYYQKFKRNKKLHNWTLKNIPIGRWADTDEIANLIIYLISNKSNYITGQNFYIDGGWTSK